MILKCCACALRKQLFKMCLTKWLVKRRSDSSISDKKAMKAAAEPLEKDQEELKQKAHKKKSSERHYLEPQMKTIRKYAVIHSNKQPVKKFSGEIIGYAMSEAI